MCMYSRDHSIFPMYILQRVAARSDSRLVPSQGRRAKLTGVVMVMKRLAAHQSSFLKKKKMYFTLGNIMELQSTKTAYPKDLM